MGSKNTKFAYIYMGRKKGYYKVRLFNSKPEEDPDRIIVIGKFKKPELGYRIIKKEELLEVVREKVEKA
ncbi:hypothetical protein Calag_1178 [Caldisphaera lagunensis DSM 15908]|uniref:DUF5622 domain-containing protein n=1 Tax=Caldisphaera lagunensis (strain DSM 15908 / JCM 11604 / ANMR 0165 / IC-154) TaxID=1056495 RepID=L0ABU1_CALLD|nr:DUF5622 domain-containing protein [Caldisphaera lagunensis]AFZ70899.1 hypothetical protein Calag_1178 [Caldisphaera lagunensis DSM 15908]